MSILTSCRYFYFSIFIRSLRVRGLIHHWSVSHGLLRYFPLLSNHFFEGKYCFFVACIILSVSEQFTYCCEHGRGKVERAGELPWFSSWNRNFWIHLSLLSMTRKYFWQIFVQIVFHLCKGGRVGPLPQVVANRSGQLSHWKQKLNKNWVLNFFRDKW